MSARILSGKLIARQIRTEIAQAGAEFRAKTGIKPHLAAVLVGSDPASQVYVRNKQQACSKAGFASSLHLLDEHVSQEELMSLIFQLNADPAVHGILVQFPLPDGHDQREVIMSIDPLKDVDCFHPENVGLMAEGNARFLPCTPSGVVEMIRRSDIEIAGKHVVILGRSSLVGRPLSQMLSLKGMDATVTLCHSRTRDLASLTRQADILVVAIGKAEFVTADMVSPGAVVIDVGINRMGDGRLVGDVAFAEVAEVASAITPVPGGVGLMTVTMLLSNTLAAAKIAAERRS